MENTYIHISDIPGESMERNHKEWIPVKTISWEVTRTLDMDDLGTTQRGYANSSFGKVSVSTELSKASPKLMLSVADGTVRKEIQINMCRSGDSAGAGMEPYLIWTLKDVVIDKYDVSGGEEQVGFHAGRKLGPGLSPHRDRVQPGRPEHWRSFQRRFVQLGSYGWRNGLILRSKPKSGPYSKAQIFAF